MKTTFSGCDNRAIKPTLIIIRNRCNKTRFVNISHVVVTVHTVFTPNYACCDVCVLCETIFRPLYTNPTAKTVFFSSPSQRIICVYDVIEPVRAGHVLQGSIRWMRVFYLLSPSPHTHTHTHIHPVFRAHVFYRNISLYSKKKKKHPRYV